MSTLENFRENLKRVTHLLLNGHTKMGKTDYLAQAARDGFTILYVDKDNALATLLEQLADDPAALARVHYVNPEDMCGFVEAIFTSLVVRYNERTHNLYVAGQTEPGDKIVEIYPSRIPFNVIMAVDSLTSLALDSMSQQADKRKISLEDIDRFTREIYGGSGFRITNIMKHIQNAPFHVVVLGHPGAYERKEKPTGKVGSIEEKDMIIKETLEVPISTSLPHGATLGKFFNQIGWIIQDRTHARKLDFRVLQGRMGGGTPSGGSPPGLGDPRSEFRFSKLFGHGKIQSVVDSDKPWIATLTIEQFKERQAAQTAAAPKLMPRAATPAAAPATPSAKPALTNFTGLVKQQG